MPPEKHEKRNRLDDRPSSEYTTSPKPQKSNSELIGERYGIIKGQLEILKYYIT